MYKHADLRPWDPRNDVCQYEYNYIIQTKTRHQTPMIRTASIVSVDPQTVVSYSRFVSPVRHIHLILISISPEVAMNAETVDFSQFLFLINIFITEYT
jgi:hypothetical protein